MTQWFLFLCVFFVSCRYSFTMLQENSTGVCSRVVSFRSRKMISSNITKLACCKKDENGLCVQFCRQIEASTPPITTTIVKYFIKYTTSLHCCNGYREVEGRCVRGQVRIKYYITIVSSTILIALLAMALSLWRCYKLKLLWWQEEKEGKQQSDIMTSATIPHGMDKLFEHSQTSLAIEAT